MALPSYVVSSLDGRVRLRHAVLRTEAGLKKALDVLGKEKKIHEVQQGVGSLLLFFDPSLQLARVLKSLEQEIPELAEQSARDRHKPMLPQCLEQLFGVSLRRIENRSLLMLVGLAVLFGFVGNGSAHTALACAVLVLMARHVWLRRQAL